MSANKKNQRKRIGAMLLACMLILVSGAPACTVAAAEKIDLRFVFTTDIHGQLTAYDYQTDKEYPKGGLSKAYTLMQEAVKEKGKTNSFTFDLGDFISDYTSEYIMGEDESALQPVYKAMKYMNYDAITLGNHEFDYGKSYYKDQLEQAGLSDKVVLSNVVDSMTGKPVYDETKMLKRTVRTSTGRKLTVKVGVIGVTVPSLSSKTDSFTGVLEAEDIEDNVTYDAERLKKKGADVVVVLAHSGVGTDNPVPFSQNVGYQLTKNSNVDVVLCGHSHTSFPSSSSESAAYYKLPGVNKKTGLMNGRVLVSAADRGQEIGVADVTLKVKNSKLSVVKWSGQVRKVKKTTEENAKIKSFMGKWDEALKEKNRISYGEIANQEPLNNYFGLTEDNAMLQMVNDSKIAYAKSWVNNTKSEYKTLPVVGASYFNRYGSNAGQDAVSLSGTLMNPMLNDFMEYKTSVSIYKLTGAMLKEWMEWSASAYETVGSQTEWTRNEDMQVIMEMSGLQPLLQEDWLHDWRNFYIFDGVEYSIDITQKPRYDIHGTKINNSSRISSLTINGEPVGEEQELLLCANRITENEEASSEALEGVRDCVVMNDYIVGQSVMDSYLTDLGKNGQLSIETDHNWTLQTPESAEFIVKAPKAGRSLARQRNWYSSKIDTLDGFDYYRAVFPAEDKDRQGPSLVVSSTNRVSTNQKVRIAVQATDPSGISSIRYSNSDSSWAGGTAVQNGGFDVGQNGTYTVIAQDRLGNQTRRTIVIDNINQNLLQAPVVNSLSNRNKAITGKAEPGAALHITTEEESYTFQVPSSGEFSYELFSPKADSKVALYVEDDRGRVSETTTIKVRRTGPNQVQVDEMTNTQDVITGTVRDTDSSLIAYVGKDVYVDKNGGKALYKNSLSYDKTRTIIPTTITQKNGTFTFHIPCQNANKTIKVMGVDHIGRVSRATSIKTIEAGPNPPSIYPVLSGTGNIRGYVKNSNKTALELTLKTAGETFRAIIGEEGYYDIQLPTAASAGDTVKVYVTDTVDGVQRKSYEQRAKVEDMGDYITNNLKDFVEWDEADDKQSDLSGTSAVTTNAFLFYDGEVYSIDEKEFGIDTGKALKPDTSAYAVCWTAHGLVKKGSVLNIRKALAAKPILLEEAIANSMSLVRIWTDERCTVNVKMGAQLYSSKDCEYSVEEEGYVYQVAIRRTNSGTPVKIYASNSAGDSPASRTTVAEWAPDAPVVNEVNDKTTYVKGMINLVDIEAVQAERLEAADAREEDTDEMSREQTEEASREQTEDIQPSDTIPENTIQEEPEIDSSHSILVKVGGKTYEGRVKEDGSFKVAIPKQKANKTIKVYGKNYFGNGPVTTVKVVKKKKQKKQ